MPTIDHILGDAGPVADLLGEGYEPRTVQTQMSQAVERAMAEESLGATA